MRCTAAPDSVVPGRTGAVTRAAMTEWRVLARFLPGTLRCVRGQPLTETQARSMSNGTPAPRTAARRRAAGPAPAGLALALAAVLAPVLSTLVAAAPARAQDDGEGALGSRSSLSP